MAFENLPTWLISIGYIFVVVIAGSALFVGAVKKKNKAKLKEQQQHAEIQKKPELEKVEVEKTETKPETTETETKKTESKDE